MRENLNRHMTGGAMKVTEMGRLLSSGGRATEGNVADED
jgi:hypothetical protein